MGGWLTRGDAHIDPCGSTGAVGGWEEEEEEEKEEEEEEGIHAWVRRWVGGWVGGWVDGWRTRSDAHINPSGSAGAVGAVAVAIPPLSVRLVAVVERHTLCMFWER